MTSEKDRSVLINWCLGAISGSIAVTIMTPYSNVRRFIFYNDSANTVAGELVKRSPIRLHSFQLLYQVQGLKGFWRGNVTNVIRYFPTQAFNFALNDLFQSTLFPPHHHHDKQQQQQSNNHIHLSKNFVSGGLAGLCSLLIIYPLDLARMMFINDVGKSPRSYNVILILGLFDCLTKTIQGPRGIRGLYHGFGIHAVSVVPYRAVYFGLFASLNEAFPIRHYNSFLTIITFQFIMAIMSVWSAMFVSYPITVLRRLYPKLSDFSAGDVKIDYREAIWCVKENIKTKGIRAFFQGISNSWRYPSSYVSAVGTLVLYSNLKNYLNSKGYD